MVTLARGVTACDDAHTMHRERLGLPNYQRAIGPSRAHHIHVRDGDYLDQGYGAKPRVTLHLVAQVRLARRRGVEVHGRKRRRASCMVHDRSHCGNR